MNESTLLTAILDKGITGGLLALACYFIAKKLASVYEARIAALEKAAEACEKDRTSMRNTFIAHLIGKHGGPVTLNLTEDKTLTPNTQP